MNNDKQKPEPGSIAEVFVKELEKQRKESHEKAKLKTTALMMTEIALLSLEQTIELKDKHSNFTKGQPKARQSGADTNKKNAADLRAKFRKMGEEYRRNHPLAEIKEVVSHIRKRLPLKNGALHSAIKIKGALSKKPDTA